jgi:hypothetical protein
VLHPIELAYIAVIVFSVVVAVLVWYSRQHQQNRR